MAILWYAARTRNAFVDVAFRMAIGRPDVAVQLSRVGGGYGGFYVPDDILREGNGLLVSAGIGFDVHFERAFANAGFEVVALDPLEDCVAFARDQLPETSTRIIHAGLWSSEGRVIFYAPREKAHDSWSAVNVQETAIEETEEFDVISIDSIVRRFPNIVSLHPAVLKMNIEGAEAEVLRNLGDAPIVFDVIAVHFESISQVRLRSPRRFAREVWSGLSIARDLRRLGFRVARSRNLQMCLVGQSHE